ncbi:hypothetical protein Bdt_1094 [Bdellovibrio bacteriovorus str. Tiberius]|uniref:Uncharacterized protein n=2 Tax=Bdellovibrio bacteriovorus TaxID=959 RepID=K7Z8L9_BDEBC|nr:hypothetical protein Bdt_1094 [Bdellovibrio bacteriovorus str. Tiberius]
MAFHSKNKFAFEQFLSDTGKPSFKLCRKLGGKPELLDFQAATKTYKLDRCLFKDASFVDTDTLLAHYIQR